MTITSRERAMKSGRDLIVRAYALDTKSITDDGKFSGYGSVFDVVDYYQEVVVKGAFTDSLNEIEKKGRPLPMLWSHRQDEPIGLYTKLSENERGLYVEGQLLVKDLARAREVHALMKAGVVSGLSIGYWVRQSSYDEVTGIRSLTKLDLEEVSPCTFPANDEARVEDVKFKLAHGAMPTQREFEKVLRDAGYSKAQAARIAKGGYVDVLRRDAESEAAMTDGMKSRLDEMAALAKSFELPKIN